MPDDTKNVPLRKVDIMVEGCGDCPFIQYAPLLDKPPTCGHGLSGGKLKATIATERELRPSGVTMLHPAYTPPPAACPLRQCDANVHLMSDEERRLYDEREVVRFADLDPEDAADGACDTLVETPVGP